MIFKFKKKYQINIWMVIKVFNKLMLCFKVEIFQK